ncbi:MAG TPA: hypothetical protein VFO25_08310 [Candidatus Eremiobacteraceae bacterium]|nr:hypothetical protein [Candidatus Eremiobacteraceae bacterium]
MDERKAATVTLLVFSGRPDPQWQLGAEEAERVRRSLQAAFKSPARKPPLIGLGYRGIRIEFFGGHSGGPAIFVVANGVVTESPGTKERYFEDVGGVERAMLGEAFRRDHGPLLERLGIGSDSGGRSR